MEQSRPIRVQVPGHGVVEFPAGTSQSDMAAALSQLSSGDEAPKPKDSVSVGGVKLYEDGDLATLAGMPFRMAGRVFKNVVVEPLKALYDAGVSVSKPGQLGASPQAALAGGAVKAAAGLVGGLLKAQGAEYGKAQQAINEGRYDKALLHGLAYLAPVIGPMADGFIERIKAGDSENVAADIISMLAPVPAAKGAPKAMTVAKAGLPDAAEAAAVQLGLERGVPVDVATATGNKALRGVQGLAENATILGAASGKRGQVAQAEKMAEVGRGMAAEANAGGASVEIPVAGERLKAGVKAKVKADAKAAAKEYQALEALEKASPVERVAVAELKPSPMGTPFSKLQKAEQEQLRLMLDDLKSHPFEAQEMRTGDLVDANFSDGMSSSAVRGEYRNQAGSNLKQNTAGTPLLHDIVGVHGGSQTGPQVIKSLEAYIEGRGPATRVPNSALITAQRYLGIVPEATEASLPRLRGMKVAQQEPRAYQAAAESAGADAALRVVEDEMGKLGLPSSHDVAKRILDSDDMQTILAAGDSLPEADLRKYVREHLSDEVGKAMPAESMRLAVDLRATKAALKPLYEQKRRLSKDLNVPAMGSEARALEALDALMEAPDYAPLSVADKALGRLTAIQRHNRDKWGEGAHVVGEAIDALDAAVTTRAKQNPAALKALEAGRKATVSKYDALALLDKMRYEPAGTVEALTGRGENGLEFLRSVERHAPAELATVGRAVLDDLMAMMSDPLRRDMAASKWGELGAQKKRLLFRDVLKRDPKYLQDLDSFFLLSKRLKTSANPSGSAYVGGTAINTAQLFGGHFLSAALTELGGLALSKAMRSPRVVRALTRGLRVPTGASAATKAAAASELAVALKSAGVPVPVALSAADRDRE